MKRSLWLFLTSGILAATAACGDDGGGTPDASIDMDGGDDGEDGSTPNDAGMTGDGAVEVPATYAFDSAFADDASSVAYSGQTARHVLIQDLIAFTNGISGLIDSNQFPTTMGPGTPSEEGEVVAALDFYYRFDSDANGAEAILLSTEPDTLQSTYDDISSGKNLIGKLAGNDDVTDHADWDGGDFVGWSDPAIATHGGGTDSPQNLVLAFFETIEANALARAEGTEREVPGDPGSQLPVQVTESGHDLSQLLEKFLLGAIAFSQGADDYLDSDVDGKGLRSPNMQDEDAPYTTLEHQWDEGFGYFGAARDYPNYTDEEIAGKGGREGWADGYHDTNGDVAIDLTAEYNFGASVNAAKRDRGSAEAAMTDFTAQGFDNFVAGRALIRSAAGRALTESEMTELEGYRDGAVEAWEKAIAATAVHYVNDTLQAMNNFGTDEYDFLDHAKVWSELKGFALGFQFNPRSPVSDDDFAMLHELIGDAPVLEDAAEEDINGYRDDLLSARALLQTAYGFDEANMGDDNGEGGW